MRILLSPDAAIAAAPVEPAAPAAPSGGGGGNNFFDDLDKEIAAPAPTAPPAKEPDKDKASSAATAGKKDDKAKPAAEPTKQPDKKLGIDQLRGEYEKTSAELKQEKAERAAALKRIEEQEAKIADWEKRGKDTAALSEKLAQLEKQYNESQGVIRGFRREQSPEFVAKYKAPFDAAVKRVEQEIGGFDIFKAGDDGQPQVARKAEFNDIRQLFNAAPSEAVRAARVMFGPDAASYIISTLQNLWSLKASHDAALDDERKTWEQKEKDEAAKQAGAREAKDRIWREVNAELAKKSPDLYDPNSLTDPKEKEILSKGFAIVDKLFSGTLNAQEGIAMDAQMRNRAASQPLVRHRLEKALARVKELEEQIAGNNGTRPGGGKGERTAPGADPTKKELSFEEELKTLGD